MGTFACNAKGKGSRQQTEAESTEVQERGRPARSSVERSVMERERRGWVIGVTLGQLERGGTLYGNEGGIQMPSSMTRAG